MADTGAARQVDHLGRQRRHEARPEGRARNIDDDDAAEGLEREGRARADGAVDDVASGRLQVRAAIVEGNAAFEE